MNRTYLDKQGLDKVADKFKSKLTMSDTIPAASSELKGKRILYTGEYKTDLYGVAYIPGRIYTCVESSLGFYQWVPDSLDTYGIVENGKFITHMGDEIDEITENSVMNDLQTGAEYSMPHWQSSFDDRVCKLFSRDLSYIKNDASIKCLIGIQIANNITKYRYLHDGESTSAFVNGYLYVLDVVEVEPVGTENPMEEKWLERLNYGGRYIFNPTHDTTVNLSKTYYDIAFIQTDIQPGVTVDNFNPDDFDVDEQTETVSLDPSQRIFNGTLEEWEALTADEQAKYGYIASPNSGGAGSEGTNDNFVGTLEEWDALSLAEKVKHKTADITNDFNGAPIDSALSDTSINPVQNRVITEALEKREVCVLTLSSVSSLPQTITNAGIENDMVVVNAVLSNPSAQLSDWNVAAGSGTLTISGTISGTTDVTLYLQKSNKEPVNGVTNSVIKNNDAAMLMEPNIAITGVTLTNYQSYIQNGRWYFSGNVKNNSGSSLPIYQSILTINAYTDTFSGNGLNVTDSKNVTPVIVLAQAGGLRFGTVIPDGNTVWVNVSARLKT